MQGKSFIEKVKQRNVLIIIVVVILLVVILLLGKLSADMAADSYQKSFDEWKVNAKTLSGRTKTAIFSDKIIMGRQETQAEYEKQATACNAAESLKKDFESDNLVPKRLASNFFGFLSTSYTQAKSDDKIKNNTIDANVMTVKQQFSSFVAECTFYVKRTALGIEHAANIEKVKAIAEKQGVVLQYPGGAIVCERSDGCIPADPAKIPAYINAYRTAEIGYAQKNIELYNKQCAATYLKPVCDVYVAYFVKTKEKAENFLAVIDKWKVTTDNPEVVAASQAMDDISASATNDIKARFAAAFPGSNTEGSYETMRLISILQSAEKKIAEATTSLASL